MSKYGKINGGANLEEHSCGKDYWFGGCKQNGKGCHDVDPGDYEDGGGDPDVTDLSYCCCDSDLCNGAEAIYFSVLTISFALTMAMAM